MQLSLMPYFKYLVCGLVASVVTAWVSAVFAKPNCVGMYATKPEQSYVQYLEYPNSALWIIQGEGFGFQTLQCREYPGGGKLDSKALAIISEWIREIQEEIPEWVFTGTLQADSDFDDIFGRSNITKISTGWPAKCFDGLVVRRIDPEGWYLCSSVPLTKPAEYVGVWQANINIGDKQFNAELSYQPLWRGLIVNVLVWSVGLWSLTFASSELRSKLRLRSGLCPNCKYPIGVSEVCTECGCTLIVIK